MMKAKGFLALPDFRRLIRPITNKIFLLLGRAVLELIEKSDEGTQRIQATALANETISNIERFQEYGFETYPVAGAEVFINFLNGNRDHGIALCVHDSRYRPTYLEEGDVCLYTFRDKTVTHRILMKPDGTTQIVCKDLDIQVQGDMTCVSTGSMTFFGGGGFSHN